MKNVSVVIATVDRHAEIYRAIAKILDNTVQPCEVVVVDQSNDVLTFEVLEPWIRSERIIYVKDSGLGHSRAKNVGWRRTSGDIVAFTDDDAMVDLRWLEKIQDSFERADMKIGAVGGKIIPLYEQKSADWSISNRWEYLLPAYDQGDLLARYRGDCLPPGVNYSVYRELLVQTGGFDESLGIIAGRRVQIYGEDADLSLRLKRMGYELVYNPECIVYHPVPLGRQNQGFLNQRLFSEGATSAILEIRTNKSVLECLIRLVDSIARYFYLTFSRRHREELYYLRGKMLALFKCGVLRQSLDSLQNSDT
jgi:GT2 family glycosyltransferase